MNAPDSIFTVQLGEAEVRVPREAAVMAYLEQEMDLRRPLPPLATQAAARLEAAIAIGAEWQGGVYAGITLHENTPQRLVLLPADVSAVDWERAIKWAEEQGGVLPSRIDLLVLWQNLRTQFKEAWYWSCEQHASGAEDAWLQGFYYGQDCWRESDKTRARAVRRIPI